MKKLIVLLMIFIVVLNLMSCKKIETNEKIETTYYGIKPSMLSDEELNEKVLNSYYEFADKYYKTVPDKEQMYLDYIFDEREDMSVEWVKRDAVTVSEAHGYAMVLLPNIANMDLENSEELKDQFDQFYRFFREHPSQYSDDLMCWIMIGKGLSIEDGSGKITDVLSLPIRNDSAIDGDMDIAYALALADNVWGSEGDINYREEAVKVMKAIYEQEVNKDEHILLLGDWVINANKEFFMTYTRSSDFMLNRLKTFAKFDVKRSEEWIKVYEKTVEIINYQARENSGETGLISDFLGKDIDGNIVGHKGFVLEDEHDGDYSWNACRFPWRLTRDFLTTGDTSVLDAAIMLDKFIKNDTGLDPLKIKPGYFVTSGVAGEPIPDRDYLDLSFIAPFTLTAAASGSQEWLENLWIFMDGHSIEEDIYFGNAIKMHVYLVLSGNMISPE